MMDSSVQEGYRKRKDTAARLPSPSGMGKGTFSKSISLLPHYTEFESQKFSVYGPQKNGKSMASPIADDDGTESKSKSESRSFTNPKRNPNASFRTQNLVFLNKKPNYEYLNPNKGRMKVRRIVRPPPQNADFCKGPTFKVSKDTAYQPFDNAAYQAIVKQAIASKDSHNMRIDKRNISNLSLNRQGLLGNPVPSKKPTEIKKQLELDQAMSNARHQRKMDIVKKIMERLVHELEYGHAEGTSGLMDDCK